MVLTRLPPLKCLADANEILGGLNARHRVEVMTKIDSYRADRRCITQAEPYVIGVQRGEVVEADGGKDIASVVEDNQAEALLDG